MKQMIDMSENPEKKDEKGQKITIEVDRNSEIKALQEELAKAKKEADEERQKLDAVTKEKIDLEQIKTNVETEREDYKAKLEAIAEKEFAAKKDAVLKRVQGVFSKPEDKTRADEIAARLNDPEKGPENLKQTEYMMGVLEDNIKKGKEDAEAEKKAKEEKEKQEAEKKALEAKGSPPVAPKGGETAPLQGQQIGGASPPASTNKGQAYESEKAMIRDLKQRSLDPRDPVKQAEAKAILNQLWKKWGITIRKDLQDRSHDATLANYEPDSKDAKKQGTIQDAETVGSESKRSKVRER